MTKAARVPRWFPPISVAVCALLIVLISITWEFSPLAVSCQAFLLIIILRFFCYCPPIITWVTRMPVPHRIVFGVMIASMILGHYTLKSRAYFPFVAWEIFPFVREEDPVVCHQFVATTASGQKVRLLTEQLFPSIVQIDPMEMLSNPKYYPVGTADHLAHALAKAYNQHHPNDPVQEVDLVAMAVKLHPPANETRTQPSCELLKRYDISSGL